MNIGILGSGVVGQTVGVGLVERGHHVKMGSRTATNEKGAAFAARAPGRASQGTFADAAAFGEVVFNCTSGEVSLDAIRAAGPAIDGKILIDVSNPLDFSKGRPPSLFVCNSDSLAERIQHAFPAVRVVKSLNTMSAQVMTNPTIVPGQHDVFVCGNDAAARQQVAAWLHEWFGWPSPIDLGDLTAARGLEMVLPIWLRLMATLKRPTFNFHIAGR